MTDLLLNVSTFEGAGFPLWQVLLIAGAAGFCYYAFNKKKSGDNEEPGRPQKVGPTSQELVQLAEDCWDAYVERYKLNQHFNIWRSLFSGDGVLGYIQRLFGVLQNERLDNLQKAERVQMIIATGLHNVLTSQLQYDGSTWTLPMDKMPNMTRDAYLFNMGFPPQDDKSTGQLYARIRQEMQYQRQMADHERNEVNYLFYKSVFDGMMPVLVDFCQNVEDEVKEDNAFMFLGKGRNLLEESVRILQQQGVVCRFYTDATEMEKEEWFVASTTSTSMPAIVRLENKYVYCKGTF